CFVFQAEDGIRDPLVTGVQTCALPIWLVRFQSLAQSSLIVNLAVASAERLEPGNYRPIAAGRDLIDRLARIGLNHVCKDQPSDKIGRASCRERVSCSGCGYRL